MLPSEIIATRNQQLVPALRLAFDFLDTGSSLDTQHPRLSQIRTDARPEFIDDLPAIIALAHS
jgi:hypothetical protein